jgi:hypothetical protein
MRYFRSQKMSEWLPVVCSCYVEKALHRHLSNPLRLVFRVSAPAKGLVSVPAASSRPTLVLDGLNDPGKKQVEWMAGRGGLRRGLADVDAQILQMSAATKILRTANAPTTAPDETELSVAQALIDLENNVPELKAELRPLQISAAREVDVRGGKKAIVIFVPVPQLKAFRKVQQRCVVSCNFYFIKYIYVVTAPQTHPRTREKVLGSPRRVRGPAPHAAQAHPHLPR